jgi:hypothetical protein
MAMEFASPAGGNWIGYRGDSYFVDSDEPRDLVAKVVQSGNALAAKPRKTARLSDVAP